MKSVYSLNLIIYFSPDQMQSQIETNTMNVNLIGLFVFVFYSTNITVMLLCMLILSIWSHSSFSAYFVLKLSDFFLFVCVCNEFIAFYNQIHCTRFFIFKFVELNSKVSQFMTFKRILVNFFFYFIYRWNEWIIACKASIRKWLNSIKIENSFGSHIFYWENAIDGIHGSFSAIVSILFTTIFTVCLNLLKAGGKMPSSDLFFWFSVHVDIHPKKFLFFIPLFATPACHKYNVKCF